MSKPTTQNDTGNKLPSSAASTAQAPKWGLKNNNGFAFIGNTFKPRGFATVEEARAYRNQSDDLTNWGFVVASLDGQICQVCHWILESHGDCSNKDCVTHQLFYLRCAGDGSWLGEDNNFHMADEPNGLWKVARADWQCVESFHGQLIEDSLYRAIPIQKAVWEHLRDYLREHGPQSFEKLFKVVRTVSPFNLLRAEIAGLITDEIKRGNMELEPNGLDFIWSGDNEPPPRRWPKRWPSLNVPLTMENAEGDDWRDALESLVAAVSDGRKALDGDSNDAEHDALFQLVTLLEQNRVQFIGKEGK